MHVVSRTENRINLESETHKAAVRLTWNEQKKKWLLTAFEKKNSALDNTTDTDKTSERGKRNDTATPQSTVSEGKDSKNSYSLQEKEEKSAKKDARPAFYSNAQRAVEGIKQEKATPEQWLKMIEKGGGLKAGEDKWLGLSDWLKGQKDKKSLTKQEVMDYIRQNQVQVEKDPVLQAMRRDMKSALDEADAKVSDAYKALTVTEEPAGGAISEDMPFTSFEGDAPFSLADRRKTKKNKELAKQYGIKISNDKDQNGSPYVLSSTGSIDFGRITADKNLAEAPIRMALGDKENGYIHIENRHGEDIRNHGFGSVTEFVEYIANNFTHIVKGESYENEKGGENQSYLVQLRDGHNNTIWMQLSRDGSYWNVNSAGVMSKRYGKNKETVWSASEVQNGGAATADNVSRVESKADKESNPNGTTSNVSAGKDTKYSLNEQEKEEKSAKKDNLPAFYSNAQRAVEGIKQEKATPEQWLKMIEKGGGLKAGEDKWLGLSDWLKGQKDKKSLTKQEVMDYIRQNQVQVEKDPVLQAMRRDMKSALDEADAKVSDAYKALTATEEPAGGAVSEDMPFGSVEGDAPFSLDGSKERKEEGFFGTNYEQFRGKFKEAVDYLFANKGGTAKGVFHREEVGDVDIPWGNTKAGLYHIINKHVVQYDDFQSVDEAVKIIDDVVDNGTFEIQKDGRAAFVKDGYRVAVERDESGNWLVTALDASRKRKEKKRSEQDATLLHQSIFGGENGELVSQQPALKGVGSSDGLMKDSSPLTSKTTSDNPNSPSAGKDTKYSLNDQEKEEKSAKINTSEDPMEAINQAAEAFREEKAGKQKVTPKQMRERRAFAERQWRRAHDVAADMVKKLNLDKNLTVVDSIDELSGHEAFSAEKKRSKGWYDDETGKIVIVMGNHRSPDDVMRTILREGVAHHGLRELFGENFDVFLDNAYKYSNGSIRNDIDGLSGSYDGDTRKATEEYLGRLAEKTDFERAEETGWWQRIKSAFRPIAHFNYIIPSLRPLSRPSSSYLYS